jgi:excinuclease ABC subunit C
VLQQARDEAHRFAITFQRKRRTMRTITSELLRIPGVGESKRRQLLETFGSLQGVRDAAPEAIAALPGFSLKTAERILGVLRSTSPIGPEPQPLAEPVASVASSDVASSRGDAVAPSGEPSSNDPSTDLP